VNRREDVGARDLRADLLRRHFDAMMATSSAGIDRSGIY
jgi:hypothetical protein